jgi:hypothetical protein
VTGGNLEFVQLVISWTVGVSASAFVIVRDERRSIGPALERAWPPASRNAAIYAFAPFCVFIHFVRTRRDLRGAAIGLGWLAAIVLTDNGLQALAAAAIDRLGL